tara:strand:- start:37055 stop:38260 length:1206 start_codon:yes stop_codon:yes gene_type:complete
VGNRVSISASEARRIALAAQGFDRVRPGNPNDVRHFRRALSSITVLQLDFVNVLIPAHFLMIWSRLGPYDRNRFERFLYDSGEFIEQWAHEASVVSSDDWPLLAHRRAAFSQHKNSPLNKLPQRDQYLRQIIEQVTELGATTAHDLPPVDGPARKPGDWHRSVPRWAIEHHFGTGRLAVRRRKKNFQRVYDLPERILSKHLCDRAVSTNESIRKLVQKATVALGVATVHDIADYYRMAVSDVAPGLQELAEEGVVSQVAIEGWSDPAYLAATARSPRVIPGASLLSPFDPVVWFRPRALRLFDLDYRIEIYVPEHKRRWGYYVLPFRQGDRITARVDLKADRKRSRLLVQNAHLERGAEASATAHALHAELCELSDWLQLQQIDVAVSNSFEKTLSGLACA